MPAVTESHVRITDPTKYDRFTRKEIAPGISQIYGWKDNKSEVQAYRFKASKYTTEQAKAWLKDHDIKWIRFDEATEIKKIEIDPKEIEMGIKVEHEHMETIMTIIADAQANKIKPLSEYYEMITMDHFREKNANPKYYTDLLTEVEDKPEEVIKKEEIIKTLFGKEYSSISEITPEFLRSLDNKEFIKVGDRIHDLFDNAKKNKRNIESYVTAANWAIDEAKKRGLEINPDSDLYKIAMGLEESTNNIEIPELPQEVIVVKDLISIVGSVAKGKKDPGDIDVLIRADMHEPTNTNYLIKAENINVPVRKIVDANKNKTVHYFSSTQGPHDDYIPLYDLVLRKKEVIKTEIIKKDLEEEKILNIFEAIINETPKENNFFAEIYKSDKPKQIVYAVVIEPMTNVTTKGDAHGDRMTEEEIENTAHLYLEKFRNVDVDHSFNPINAVPVESYISPVDFKAPNGSMIKKGSWILGIKVNDAAIWDKIERGELNAYSPGGWGYKKELVKKFY